MRLLGVAAVPTRKEEEEEEVSRPRPRNTARLCSEEFGRVFVSGVDAKARRALHMALADIVCSSSARGELTLGDALALAHLGSIIGGHDNDQPAIAAAVQIYLAHPMARSDVTDYALLSCILAGTELRQRRVESAVAIYMAQVDPTRRGPRVAEMFIAGDLSAYFSDCDLEEPLHAELVSLVRALAARSRRPTDARRIPDSLTYGAALEAVMNLKWR